MSETILLFDGVCNLCNAGVQFILDHESAPMMKFASMQSQAGKRILGLIGVKEFPRSMILVKDGTALFRSQALISVSKCLKVYYRWLAWLVLIPPIVLDPIYDIVARNRYRWFGKRESCMVESDELRERFLQS